ncbi:GNAT family N-acetyltransferase [Methylophaga sp.]|uniref:GNAT family N-acetyltransferase n=1 Tax=Methylophaga sp. TaxID=2024840 RepID=UPI003F6A1ABD
MIRPANQQDTKAITALLIRCAEVMSQRGMHHWLGVYDEQSVSQNLTKKQVYVLEENDSIVGCVALGTKPADYYQDCWPDAPIADYYLTQLAVMPEAQGSGHGKELMLFCINQVGNARLQLDAVDHYPALLQFYQNLGFKIISTGIGLGDKRHLFSNKD